MSTLSDKAAADRKYLTCLVIAGHSSEPAISPVSGICQMPLQQAHIKAQTQGGPCVNLPYHHSFHPGSVRTRQVSDISCQQVINVTSNNSREQKTKQEAARIQQPLKIPSFTREEVQFVCVCVCPVQLQSSKAWQLL